MWPQRCQCGIGPGPCGPGLLGGGVRRRVQAAAALGAVTGAAGGAGCWGQPREVLWQDSGCLTAQSCSPNALPSAVPLLSPFLVLSQVPRSMKASAQRASASSRPREAAPT